MRTGLARRHGAIVTGLLLLTAAACSEPVEPSSVTRPSGADTPTPARSDDRSATGLVLLTATDYEDTLGFRHVEGRVTNPSARTLTDVLVVVTWYTDWEDLVTTRQRRLEPIPAGETTSFDVTGPAIPFASKFSVVFTDSDGISIPTEHRPS